MSDRKIVSRRAVDGPLDQAERSRRHRRRRMERDIALATAIADMVVEGQPAPQGVIVQFLKEVAEKARERSDGVRDEDVERIERAVLRIDDTTRRRTLFARTQLPRH